MFPSARPEDKEQTMSSSTARINRTAVLPSTQEPSGVNAVGDLVRNCEGVL